MPDRVPLTPWLSLLPYLISILALSLPSPSLSFPLRLSLFLLALALTTHILTSTSLPLASLNFSQGAALAAHVFAASDYLLLSDVHNDLKRHGQTGAWETMGQWERVRWAASLVTSPRLIGWSSTTSPSPSSPPPPSRSPTPPSHSTSTTSYILHQSLHLLLELLALLALLTFSSSLPHLSATGPALAAASYPLRLLYAPLLGLAMYASIDAPHRIWVLLLLCVGNTVIRVYNRYKGEEIQVWTPADFPPLFGHWRDAYTLRRFWGRTWQQTHRRKFKSHSRFVQSLILPPLPPSLHHPLSRTISRTIHRTIDLYTAFLISGLMHAAGEYMMLSSSPSSHKQGIRGVRAGGSTRFFMLQALGVHVESIVLSVFGRWLGRWLGRWIAPTLTTPTATRDEVDGASAPAPLTSPRLKIPKFLNPLNLPLMKIPLMKILGYIYVWLWFAYTAPVLFDPLVGAGFVDDLRGVLGRYLGR